MAVCKAKKTPPYPNTVANLERLSASEAAVHPRWSAAWNDAGARQIFGFECFHFVMPFGHRRM